MIALQISHTVQTSTEHCSIASHCLALSYWRCSWRFIIGTFPKWPISIVMDAWFYCAKRALSHSSKLLSRAGWWAVLILSPLTFSPFLASFKWKPQRASSSKEAISPGTNVFYYLLISLSMHFVASSILSGLFACVYARACQPLYRRIPMSLQAYAYMHVAAFKLSRKPRCVLDAVSTLSFCALDAISSYLENTTINHLNYCWQTSKRFWLAAHFLSISNTQVGRNTKEQKLQKDVRLCGSVVRWKWQEMSSLLGWKVQHGICSSWFCVKCHMHLFINSNS